MPTHISGKVIVVTGAGSGFGRLVSQRAAAAGAKVVAADINAAALEETVAGIKAGNGAATGLPTDVTDLAAMQALAAHAVKTYGAIDVMINNAGIMPLAFYADHAKGSSTSSPASCPARPDRQPCPHHRRTGPGQPRQRIHQDRADAAIDGAALRASRR
jgi:NAD(P)-dependent dehydrogenase (short-subunit alcohol dehydrogenase family)